MHETLLMLLLQAAESPLGIAIRTDNVQLVRNKLYALAKEHPELPKFALISPPVGSDSVLWIVKKGDNDGAT